jgi:hypothetical protein
MVTQPRVLPPADGAAPGAVTPDVTGWVQSLAVARHSDLIASGAGDGCVRLWEAVLPGAGSHGALSPVGALPARGFVNGLALGRSGRLVVAALGQVRGKPGGTGNAAAVVRVGCVSHSSLAQVLGQREGPIHETCHFVPGQITCTLRNC